MGTPLCGNMAFLGHRLALFGISGSISFTNRIVNRTKRSLRASRLPRSRAISPGPWAYPISLLGLHNVPPTCGGFRSMLLQESNPQNPASKEMICRKPKTRHPDTRCMKSQWSNRPVTRCLKPARQVNSEWRSGGHSWHALFLIPRPRAPVRSNLASQVLVNGKSSESILILPNNTSRLHDRRHVHKGAAAMTSKSRLTFCSG